MALNQRQKAAYKHLIDIYSVTRSINASTGKPGAETVALVASGIPCRYEYTDNISDATVAGRIKRPTIYTTDSLHLEASVNILEGWYVVNRSIVNGAHSKLYGEVHRVLGSYHVNPSQGVRRSNKQSLQIATVEKLPGGISV